jgi:hypothetical protein
LLCLWCCLTIWQFWKVELASLSKIKACILPIIKDSSSLNLGNPLCPSCTPCATPVGLGAKELVQKHPMSILAVHFWSKSLLSASLKLTTSSNLQAG